MPCRHRHEEIEHATNRVHEILTLAAAAALSAAAL
jgi:hypothetical protein